MYATVRCDKKKEEKKTGTQCVLGGAFTFCVRTEAFFDYASIFFDILWENEHFFSIFLEKELLGGGGATSSLGYGGKASPTHTAFFCSRRKGVFNPESLIQ